MGNIQRTNWNVGSRGMKIPLFYQMGRNVGNSLQCQETQYHCPWRPDNSLFMCVHFPISFKEIISWLPLLRLTISFSPLGCVLSSPDLRPQRSYGLIPREAMVSSPGKLWSQAPESFSILSSSPNILSRLVTSVILYLIFISFYHLHFLYSLVLGICLPPNTSMFDSLFKIMYLKIKLYYSAPFSALFVCV